LTVDDIWQIADASDQELWRLAHSIHRGSMELGAEDKDGLSQQACTALADSASHHASAETHHALGSM